MQASETQLLKFLDGRKQFVIPIYQRMYSWEEKHCRQLWDDIMRCGKDDGIDKHFLGSIVYIESTSYHISTNNPMIVIDGQQRLTTITLLFKALAETLNENFDEEFDITDSFSARKIHHYYLINSEEKGESIYKLLLSKNDAPFLKAIIDKKEISNEETNRVFKNYNLFKKWTADSQDNLQILCKGLRKLSIIDISLKREQDNPQLIFESMNSTGKGLSQADLIRNFILMNLNSDEQEEIYTDFWHPMEEKFGEAYDKHFNGFVRNYLILKTGEGQNINDVYENFKKYKRKQNNISIKDLMRDIKKFAEYYCCMALGQEKDKDLKLAFKNLIELVGVAYPLLLELYNRYDEKCLDKNDFLEALNLIESYVFRRAVCEIPPNSLNKTFIGFPKALKEDECLESVKAYFLLMPSYRRFPNNQEFESHIKSRNLYNFGSKNYLLRKLENYDREDPIEINEYTIEHIMPQNPKLPNGWKKILGDNWKEIHEKYIHTLGNLTLTAYNSKYKDKSFTDKRDMNNGFKHSHLKLNDELKFIETWDEEAITKRADRLAKKALTVWKNPELSDDILEQYKEDKRGISQYSINNHQHIDVGSDMHDVFEAFRKEVLDLDLCVSEEFLAKYVAYKAETNFVIVIPQKAEIKLSLNMPFSKINDAKAICKDTTELGRWGNYDIEVGLGNINDLPYIMGLVRQALEYQLYNSDDSEI